MNTLRPVFQPLRIALTATVLALTGLSGTVAAQDVTSERLWLPASASNLRPFLVMAVNKVKEDPACAEVLYARLNEYRTIYEEPTFTILCQKDPKTTFNRVVKITEVDPEYFEPGAGPEPGDRSPAASAAVALRCSGQCSN